MLSKVNINLIPPVANAGINFSQALSFVQTKGPDNDTAAPAPTVALTILPSNLSSVVVVVVRGAAVSL